MPQCPLQVSSWLTGLLGYGTSSSDSQMRMYNVTSSLTQWSNGFSAIALHTSSKSTVKLPWLSFGHSNPWFQWNWRPAKETMLQNSTFHLRPKGSTKFSIFRPCIHLSMEQWNFDHFLLKVSLFIGIEGFVIFYNLSCQFQSGHFLYYLWPHSGAWNDTMRKFHFHV